MKKILNNILKSIISFSLFITLLSGSSAHAQDTLHYMINQDATAYVVGSQTSTGLTPIVGMVAVHPVKNYSPLTPVIPYGTTIFIDEVTNPSSGETKNHVTISGNNITSFVVADIGDENYSPDLQVGPSTYRQRSLYFIDIYFGSGNTFGALEFGWKVVDYYFYADPNDVY